MQRRFERSAMALLVGMVQLSGCSEPRATEVLGGVHPSGWTTTSSAAFHGTELRARGYPLSECADCHGIDGLGGPVRSSCVSASCHTSAPMSSCTACHGTAASPMPATGAHKAHERYCNDCHKVPTVDGIPAHAAGDHDAGVIFSGLAAWSSTPSYDRTSQTCSNTYCHGVTSPAWTAPSTGGCDGGFCASCTTCHQNPPTSHASFSRAAKGACSNCHAGAGNANHIDGKVVVAVNCGSCHGSVTSGGAPPAGLDGQTDAAAPSVGAHQRHLDPTLVGRMGKVVACAACHNVPTEVNSPGHLSGGTSRVSLFDGTYDPTTKSCVVSCHFDKNPGPVWTDTSGAARACNGCHAFPPDKTRAGTPHATVAADEKACLLCHTFSPETHVNGVVEYLR